MTLVRHNMPNRHHRRAMARQQGRTKVTDEMNGVPAPQAQPPEQQQPVQLDDWQQKCVEMLEGALESARQGHIHALGLVAVFGPGRFAATGVMAGLLELSAGTDNLKDQVKASINGIAERAQAAMEAAKPKILRPEPGFDPQRMG